MEREREGEKKTTGKAFYAILGMFLLISSNEINYQFGGYSPSKGRMEASLIT